MTAGKDCLTTINRMVTSGETDDIQGRLKQGCEGLAPLHTVPAKEHHTKLQHRIMSNILRVFRERVG